MKKPQENVRKGVEYSAEKIAREIEKLAFAGDFSSAERWRQVLLAKHPMALSEIISTAELIEDEKTRRIDHDHLAMWDALYRRMTEEERNCLFYSTRRVAVSPGKIILKQGAVIPRLLFIESGRVTLFHSKGKDRILIGQLSRGDIIGDETFFQLSAATLSAGCQTDVQLRYLDKSAVISWEEKCPGLYQRLSDYCQKYSRSQQMMQHKNIEKRAFTRKKSESKLRAFLISSEGVKSSEHIRGSVMDVSRNGISFDIHSSRPENAHRLLGKAMEIEVERGVGGPVTMLKISGTVVKVGILMHNDYSIHVKLDKVFDAEEFNSFF